MTRAIFACILALGLSACFFSEQPLIGAAESEHPVAAGDYWSLDGGERDERMIVTHDGPDTLVKDENDEQPSILRFRSLGGGLYVMQTQEDGGYLYGAARLDGGRIEVWLSDCSDLTDADRGRLGLAITANGDCEMPDWETLAEATPLAIAGQEPGTVLVAD